MPARARGWLALVLATCGPQRAVQPRRVAEAAAPRGPRRARGRTASDRCARRSTRGAESRTAEGEAMTHESRTNRTTGTSDPRENRTRSGPVQTAHVRPGVLARALGVDERTVRRWCAEGRIAGAVRTAGGHWRVPRAEYARLTEGRARARADGAQAHDHHARSHERERGEPRRRVPRRSVDVSTGFGRR